MHVDRRALTGAYAITHLDVREDDPHARKPTLLLLGDNRFVDVDAVVVRDPKCADLWRRGLYPGEELLPCVVTAVLVVEHRSGRVDVGVPPMPIRAT